MSLLIGIALEEGYLKSKYQPIQDYFPEFFAGETDVRKREITIEDLLTMRAGLETTSFDNYARWVSSNNWIQYALNRPLVEEPGGDRMIYSTGNSHLLSVILTRATGMSTRAFAQKYLLDPMGIELPYWPRGPQGYFVGGNNIHMKPSDMIKIGRMVLNGGKYAGRQIVPEKWLVDSFRSYTQSNNNSSYYGYMWWKQSIKGYQVLFACGYGGQYIFIVPELESVVVVTSYLEYATEERRYHEPIMSFMEHTVVPYLLEDRPMPERVISGRKPIGSAIAR
jgi:CubicO group peptidase (beta-lactamase class C family)